MIPIHDDNPTSIRPFVTVGLVVACALVFLWQPSLPVDRTGCNTLPKPPAVSYPEACTTPAGRGQAPQPT